MSQYTSNMSNEERQRLINSIPEASVFDSYKENIQPRKEGRSAIVMNTFLDLNTSEKEQELKRGHLRFKEQLESLDELDDPLSVYVNYVDWILHHYPQGHSKESELLPTLKAATESFVGDVRYKQSPSYLKICLEYAKWVEDASTIYRFLIANEIGQKLSLFYEEYASYLEKKLKYDDAGEIFRLGLTNQAIPKERLERNFQKFKDRIKERGKKAINKRPDALLKSAGRTMLGVKTSSESRSSQPSNVFNRTQSLYGSPTPSSSSSSIGRNFSSTTRPTTTTTESFKVFKESSSSPSSSTALPTGNPRLLATRSTLTHSENKSRSDSYSGVTIKQAPFTPPPTEKFSIFRDSESPAPVTPNTATLERGLSFTSDNSDSVNIRKKPLSNDLGSNQKRKKVKETPTSKFNLDRFNKYHKNEYIETTDSQGRPEIIAAFKHTLSFEELRANNMRKSLEKIQEEDVFFSGFIPERQTRESSPIQEITAETKRAHESMRSIFGSDTSRQEEEDITWTKEYQTFKPFVPKNIDENDYPN